MKNQEQPVTFVRFSRRTRGMSYCCSWFLVPVLTVIIAVAARLISYLLYFNNPGKFQNPLFDFDVNKIALILIFSFLLSSIFIALVLYPKRIDRLIDWWFGL